MKFGVDSSVFPAASNNATNIIWNQLVNSDYYAISTNTTSPAFTMTHSGGYDAGIPPDDSYPYAYIYADSTNYPSPG